MIYIDSSFIVIFIIIWVLLYVLSKIFFNPVRKIMAEREAKIRENKESCEKASTACEQCINEIDENLSSAKAISDAKREEFEKEAFKEKSQLLEEINTECREKAEKSRAQLEEQIKGLKKELILEAEVLAERIEQRLLH